MLTVRAIKKEESHGWIMRKHYAKRIPPISYAFGLYDNVQLVGIVTYGQPASPYLCRGICGEAMSGLVIELNRLVISTERKNAASFLVGASLKKLRGPMCVVSYADIGMGHIGYVYQATNWLYTGKTKERTDMAAGDGKHSRHNLGNANKRQVRTAKHRYVYFVGNKSERKEMESQLRYETHPYPKGDTKRYDASARVATQELLI